MGEQAYIYDADIYCVACAEKIKARIDAEGGTPANPDDERTFDSGEYPKGPYDNGGGEADSPQHCRDCQTPLLNDLTSDGQKYVIEALQEYVQDGGGSGNGEVLDGWAEQLHDYSLDKSQKFVVDAFEALRKAEQLSLIQTTAENLLDGEIAIGQQFRDGMTQWTLIQRFGNTTSVSPNSKLLCIDLLNLQDNNSGGRLMKDCTVYRFPSYFGDSMGNKT